MAIYDTSKPIIIYDLDGTLIDSAEMVGRILNELRNELHLPLLERENFFPWISLGGEGLIKYALELEFQVDILHYLQVFRSRYYEIPTPLNTVYDGVFDCLEYLRSNQYGMAICTNKPRALAEKVLKETGLKLYFDFMCAGGDLPTKKPSKKNVQVCLDYFGVSPQKALFIGDSSVDQEIAKAVDMPFLFYLHGYDDGVNKELIRGELDHHNELIKFLSI
jgi:phosphoglycolate phosphatase